MAEIEPRGLVIGDIPETVYTGYQFDWNTGEILSILSTTDANVGLAWHDDPEIADTTSTTVPDNFSQQAYRIKAVGSYSSPHQITYYFIENATGYAYSMYAVRKPGQDEEPPDEEEPAEVTPTRETTVGDTEGSGESGAEEETDSDTLARISDGGVLVNVRLNLANWAQDVETGQFVRAIANPYITPSTVLYVTGVNRHALTAHVYWAAEDGLITFTTASLPSEDLLLNGVLADTEDDWSAKGVIEAWPGAGLVSKRFRQSLNASDWSVTLSARGTAGDTVTILTRVGFANAQLLFATPEWTGNTHVVIPSVFVHDDYQRLCYTLTNLSDDDVTITEVALRLMYSGTVSNLTEETQDSAALSGYITEVDIDELS